MKNFKHLTWLVFIVQMFAQAPITITGTITDASNNIATSGYIQFDITPASQALAYSVPPSTVVANPSKCSINSSGQPAGYPGAVGACTVWPNDLIIPSNTLYKITIAPGNKITKVYNGVLLKQIVNPQSLASLTFVSPQSQVVGTIVNGNPLVTMTTLPAQDSVWTLGDPQHRYACVYANCLNGSPITGIGGITGATPNGGLVVTGTTLGMLTTCTSNQVLAWNGTAWVCTNNGPSLPPPVFPPHTTILITYGTSAPQALGLNAGVVPYHAGTSNPTIIPSAVNPAGTHFTSPASASTTESIYIALGQNGSQSILFPLLAFNYFATRLSLQALTNCRYYWGLNTWGTGSTFGTNGSQVGGTSKFATDTPNSSTIGFRYSNGTDTNFKAVTINPGASPVSTVVDTGVVADTNVHLFEIYPNATSTAMLFYIDKNLVANISTNLPAPPAGNSLDAFADIFLSGDNKNTATSVAMDFYSMEVAIRVP